MLAQGTPMIVAGDEFSRTQHGNNNAYCQDSEIGWVNWDLSEDGKALLKFVKRLIKLRLAYPILRRGRFLVGEYNEDIGVKDVTWLAPDGNEMTTEQWQDSHGRCLGMLMDGRLIDHPDFEKSTQSWRLGAVIFTLRALGWPVEAIEVPSPTEQSPDRVIALYRLDGKYTAQALALNGGAA